MPHAGYVYSGPIAATGYATLARARGHDRAGACCSAPPTRSGVDGLAVPSADAFATPLGTGAVDTELRDRVLALRRRRVDDAAHAPEHSLEVHLPFLQRVLGPTSRVLPLVVGARAADDGRRRARRGVGRPRDRSIVVSTDLSHYLDYDTPRRRTTARTADADRRRRELDAIAPDDACGAVPAARPARRRPNATASTRELLDLRNSGDTAGPRDRVVGYGAFACVAR